MCCCRPSQSSRLLFSKGKMSDTRAVRKQQQLNNLVAMVTELARPGHTVVDFCSGGVSFLLTFWKRLGLVSVFLQKSVCVSVSICSPLLSPHVIFGSALVILCIHISPYVTACEQQVNILMGVCVLVSWLWSDELFELCFSKIFCSFLFLCFLRGTLGLFWRTRFLNVRWDFLIFSSVANSS